mmetsp:Transcript_120827/g.352986  ORF Transcript_120827/g.352986 Transcript_120827/m.352986 type:complete len:234 (-) Transcript_120827:330-1031(-)
METRKALPQGKAAHSLEMTRRTGMVAALVPTCRSRWNIACARVAFADLSLGSTDAFARTATTGATTGGRVSPAGLVASPGGRGATLANGVVAPVVAVVSLGGVAVARGCSAASLAIGPPATGMGERNCRMTMTPAPVRAGSVVARHAVGRMGGSIPTKNRSGAVGRSLPPHPAASQRMMQAASLQVRLAIPRVAGTRPWLNSNPSWHRSMRQKVLPRPMLKRCVPSPTWVWAI